MRKFALLVLFALVMSIVAAPAFAQDAVFCGDLAAEDCDLLKANATAMESLTSASAQFEVQLDMENIPNSPNLNISVTGDGAYSLSGDMMAMAEEMVGLEGQEAFDATLELLKGFAGTLNLNVSLPAEVAAQAGLPSGDIALELALVDGVGYINFDTVDALAGGQLSAMGFTGWAGLDFIDVIQQFVASSPDMLDTFSSSFNAGLSAGSMMDMTALEGLTQYISMERVEDVDGAAVFVTTVDFGGMASDPAFQDLVKGIVEAQGQAMSDSEFTQAMGILQLMAQDIEIKVTQYVDPDSAYTLSAEISVVVDMTNLMAASGATADGDAVISVVASIDYTGHNDTTVTAPDAPIAKFADVMQMMGGMSGN